MSKLEVPKLPDIEPDILPPEDLSVWEFAFFELPRPSRTIGKASNIADYFVTGTPKVVNADYVYPLIAPKNDLVEKLYEHMTTSLTATSDTTVVQCLHLPSVNTIGLMPLWIITFLKHTKDLLAEKSKWGRAKQLLTTGTMSVGSQTRILARFRVFLHPRYAETSSKIFLSVYRCETGDFEHFSNRKPIRQTPP
jgi:hypothetical protein